MATAQQLIVDQFAQLINADPNLNTRVIASTPTAGILRVTARGTEDPRINYLAAGSNVTGAGTFAAKAATGSPKYAELWFSWTLAPGDSVKMNVGTGVLSVDKTYQLPVATVVDPGGFDHTTLGTGGGGVAVGGVGIGSAMHRRLVVMECGSASPSFGSLFALDPQDATGIAIPTFRVTNALPTAGSTIGEALFVTATRSGFVWDGNGWRDVTASPIRSFPNDAALQQDIVEAVGVYAVATDTGNMYIRVTDGWRRIGVAEFATYADLDAWDAAIGTQAISRDLNVLFLRVEDAPNVESWIPISQLVKTQAQVLAAPNIAGLTAVALDTGRRFVNNGARWIEDPIEHYPTETALLAAVPTDGHLAWADDTSVVFLASGNQWHRLQGPQITYGTTAPTTPGVGDFWFDSNANRQTLNIWNGARWVNSTGATLGVAGSRLIIPGYDNENPSATATADDLGGLAFRYNGTQTQLFLNKGTAWNAMTPMLGNAANSGKVVIADAAGNMTWGNPPNTGPTYQRIDADVYTVSEKVIALSKNCTQWFEMWGMVQCGSSYRAEPIVYFGGTKWDFWSTTNNLHPQSMCAYEAGGLRDCNNTYFSGHGCGFVYKGQTSYDVKASHPLMFTLKATKLGTTYWLFDLTSKFHSGNGSPMLMTASWQSTTTNAITNVGVKTAQWDTTTGLNGPYSFQVRYM
jgi:hypothetical protein